MAGKQRRAKTTVESYEEDCSESEDEDAVAPKVRKVMKTTKKTRSTSSTAKQNGSDDHITWQ